MGDLFFSTHWYRYVQSSVNTNSTCHLLKSDHLNEIAEAPKGPTAPGVWATPRNDFKGSSIEKPGAGETVEDEIKWMKMSSLTLG